MSNNNLAATEDALSELHAALADKFKEMLTGKEDVPPSTLNTVRQFLKDNNIDCTPSENSTMEDIKANLPKFTDNHEDLAQDPLIKHREAS